MMAESAQTKYIKIFRNLPVHNIQGTCQDPKHEYSHSANTKYKNTNEVCR